MVTLVTTGSRRTFGKTGMSVSAAVKYSLNSTTLSKISGTVRLPIGFTPSVKEMKEEGIKSSKTVWQKKKREKGGHVCNETTFKVLPFAVPEANSTIKMIGTPKVPFTPTCSVTDSSSSTPM